MHESLFRIRDSLISISTWVNLSDPTPVPFHSPLSQLVPFLDDDDHEDDDGEVAKKMECSVASITKVLVHADYQDDDDVDNNDELWIDW